MLASRRKRALRCRGEGGGSGDSGRRIAIFCLKNPWPLLTKSPERGCVSQGQGSRAGWMLPERTTPHRAAHTMWPINVFGPSSPSCPSIAICGTRRSVTWSIALPRPRYRAGPGEENLRRALAQSTTAALQLKFESAQRTGARARGVDPRAVLQHDSPVH